MSEETEEANAEKLVSEISVTGGGEIQESLQKTKETELFGKILEMIEEEKKNKGEILNRLEVLNERFNEKLELEKLQRSKDVLVLREETQQTIQSVNGKLNNLSSCMYTSLELQKSEAKQIQGEMSKQLGEYKSEVKGEMRKIQTEFAKLRQDLNFDSLGVLEGKLEAKMDEGFEMRLRKFESQLENLSGVGSAVRGDYYRSPVDNGSSQVHKVDDGHSGLLPTPVPPAVPSSQRNYMSDKNRNESVEIESEEMGTSRGLKENYGKINTLTGGVKYHGPAMGDLTLPKFSDCQSQHIVNFLEELDSYFQLKAVPVEMKLPLAMKSVTDEYVRQWVTTMYREIKDYDHFKQAIIELLWSPQVQSQVRCSIYQDKFKGNGDDSLSVHFLRYASIAANLTPKMSDLEVIDALCGHYPNYIQRALLSANIRTIQQALNFLSKLQIMEDSEANIGLNNENTVPRSGYDTSANRNRSRNYGQRPQPQSVRYTRYRENSRYGYNRQNDQRVASRAQPTDTSRQWRGDPLNPNAESYDPRRNGNGPINRNTEPVVNRQGNSQ